MAVYPVGDAAADRTLCSSGRSADEEGEMVLADLQTLEFEALIAEEKCLVELHAALPLTLRSTEETVTIDKWLCSSHSCYCSSRLRESPPCVPTELGPCPSSCPNLGSTAPLPTSR